LPLIIAFSIFIKFKCLIISCADVDECREAGGNLCTFGCENIPGGYRCVCPDGFGLAEDGHSCEPQTQRDRKINPNENNKPKNEIVMYKAKRIFILFLVVNFVPLIFFCFWIFLCSVSPFSSSFSASTLLDHPHQQFAERLKVRGIAQEKINAGDIGLMMAQGLFKYGKGIYLFI
jgi:hypothetical protein